MAFQLEVIAFNLESCTTIAASGAHRVELCMNPQEGGTTPSAGFIQLARQIIPMELFPIIRPRGGDFLYTDAEIECMKHDIRICKNLGCDGVVLGMLNENGTVNTEQTQKLVELAYPMEVTFHRAFDRVADPFTALEDIIRIGCTRILTSGLEATAIEGKGRLRQLILQADGRITVMPGSGVRASNIRDIALETNAEEFHTSARKYQGSRMRFQNQSLTEDMEHVIADPLEISDCLQMLSELPEVKN